MRIAMNASLVVVLFLFTGCGSIVSRWRGERGPYVGVKLSAETASRFNHEPELIVAALDIPLSAIVDTLYLPYDLMAGAPAKHDEGACSDPNTGPVSHKH